MNAPYTIERLSGLGLGQVGQGERTVIHTNKYDQYWPTHLLKGTASPIVPEGDRIGTKRMTDTTAVKMIAIIRETAPQTAAIARHLQGSSLTETIRNIYRYHFQYYQYKEDDPDTEQLRDPVRSYADRYEGIDCDCFVISAGAMLYSLGIPFSIRRARYDAGSDYAHVYIIVPSGIGSGRSSYIVLDPVVHQYDYEWPSNQKPAYYSDDRVTKGMNGLSGFSVNPLEGLGFTSIMGDMKLSANDLITQVKNVLSPLPEVNPTKGTVTYTAPPKTSSFNTVISTPEIAVRTVVAPRTVVSSTQQSTPKPDPIATIINSIKDPAVLPIAVSTPVIPRRPAPQTQQSVAPKASTPNITDMINPFNQQPNTASVGGGLSRVFDDIGDAIGYDGNYLRWGVIGLASIALVSVMLSDGEPAKKPSTPHSKPTMGRTNKSTARSGTLKIKV